MADKADSGGKAEPTSTELMLSLSQIQQLIPLLDYKPGGLAHLVPNLLLPLLPIASTSSADPIAVSMGLSGLTQAAQQDAVKRYRDHVQHAFRVASELVLRLQDPTSPAASAIHLAQRIMQQQQQRDGAGAAETERERILRVRKKRKLLLEQDRMLQSSFLQPAPTQPVLPAEASAQTQPSAQPAEPPTAPQNIQLYLVYVRNYLTTAVPLPLVKSTKIRLVTFTTPSQGVHSFTLELHVKPVLKAVLESTWASEQNKVVLAAVRIVSYSEDVMATATVQSDFPVFRALSAEVMHQVARSRDTQTSQDPWQMYAQLTQTIAQILSSAAQFQ